MKKILVVAVASLVGGALGACSQPRPDPAKDRPAADFTPPPVPAELQPQFGTLVRQDEPPPPISGGTLVVAADQATAVAADPDRDRVFVVDLTAGAVRHTVQLPKHSEPGRVALDDGGHAHVVLRRAGGLATIDLATGALSIRDVCIAPRGLAFDAAEDALHVACANGELVTVSLRKVRSRSEPLQRRVIARDLRDVVMQRDGSMIVTTFRTASRIRVWGAAEPLVVPPPTSANLAWRSVLVPTATPADDCKNEGCSDALAVVHQQPTPQGVEVQTDTGGYGGAGPGFDPQLESSGCGAPRGIVTTRVELGDGFVDLPEAVLPVDLATSGRELVVVAAGNAFTRALPQLFVVQADDVRSSRGDCVPAVHGNVPGQATAAAFDGNGRLLVQTREPAALHIMTEDRRSPSVTIRLAADSVADTGHAIFHANAGGFIACASCHAEGADDGHVWSFAGLGPRRTPSLLGTVAGTEPFHWDGDQKDLRELVDHVFVQRMSGPALDDGPFDALGGYV